MTPTNNRHAFPRGEKNGVYRAILTRRDIRARFRPDPIPEDVLARLLHAAHHSGSVGFMQPWNFIVIRDREVKVKVRALFASENRRAARHYRGARRKKYASLKLEGILEAPVNLCVTCDRDRGGPHVLGRNTIRETDLFSTCCAIQNLWLAARAEGIGVGWVSILRNAELKRILRIPGRVYPVAYLCLGYVTDFPERPMLEETGWRKRLALRDLIFFDRWKGRDSASLAGLARCWNHGRKEQR
jgi:5,6-dimethylbenzimidazole synthase